MLDAHFYDLTQSLWGGLAQAMGKVRLAEGESVADVPPLMRVQGGRAESPGWFLVQAMEFDPEPVTVETLRRRDVYASPRIVTALLEVMTAEQWFQRRGEAYYLTDNGRSLMKKRFEDRNRWLAQVQAQTDMGRLAQLLRRALNACLACDDPPGNWCLVHSRYRAPSADSAAPVKLFQYIADINAFRDDAHMAAWQSQVVSGHEWEAFNFVAEGEATTAVALWQALSYRGYSAGEYADALALLEQRGWLTTDDGLTYAITSAGKQICADVEKQTDFYFYTPWQTVLTETELQEVHDLIVALRNELAGSQ